jgi:hypothetical protein
LMHLLVHRFGNVNREAIAVVNWFREEAVRM